MEKISDWMVQSCLTLNFSKTVSMFFSIRNTSHSAPEVIVKGTRIHEAESVKYLGVVLDRTLEIVMSTLGPLPLDRIASL